MQHLLYCKLCMNVTWRVYLLWRKTEEIILRAFVFHIDIYWVNSWDWETRQRQAVVNVEASSRHAVPYYHLDSIASELTASWECKGVGDVDVVDLSLSLLPLIIRHTSHLHYQTHAPLPPPFPSLPSLTIHGSTLSVYISYNNRLAKMKRGTSLLQHTCYRTCY